MPAFGAALIMEGPPIREDKSQPARASDEASERVFAEFASADTRSINADGRQQWQATGVAKIKEPIEMTRRAIHLVPSLRPLDTAGSRELTICRAFLPHG